MGNDGLSIQEIRTATIRVTNLDDCIWVDLKDHEIQVEYNIDCADLLRLSENFEKIKVVVFEKDLASTEVEAMLELGDFNHMIKIYYYGDRGIIELFRG